MLICSLRSGAPIKPEALLIIMKKLRKRMARMLESGTIDNDAEKEKLSPEK
jgi:hypothetical protein